MFCHKYSMVFFDTGYIVFEGTVQPFLPLKSLDQDEVTPLNGFYTRDIVLGRIFVHSVHFGGTLIASIV